VYPTTRSSDAIPAMNRKTETRSKPAAPGILLIHRRTEKHHEVDSAGWTSKGRTFLPTQTAMKQKMNVNECLSSSVAHLRSNAGCPRTCFAR
jgi:hypothetical protein